MKEAEIITRLALRPGSPGRGGMDESLEAATKINGIRVQIEALIDEAVVTSQGIFSDTPGSGKVDRALRTLGASLQKAIDNWF